MNILFVAPYVPSRIRVRPFQIIKELSKRHNVTAVVLGEVDGRKTQMADELLNFVHSLHVIPHSKLKGYRQSLFALPTATPMCAAFCWSREMGRKVQDVLSDEKIDIVHVEHLRAAHHIGRMHNVPVVFDSVDCLTGLFSQMAKRKKNPVGKAVMLEESIKLRYYEPKMIGRFDRTIITSDSERDELLALNPSIPIDVIPNGVDTDYFAPSNVMKNSKRIVFSGKMSYAPNAQAAIWFAEKAFPVVKKNCPDAEFVIVGSNPPSKVMELANISGIKVTGFVDDIRPYLHSSAVAVVPMQVAVGIQNKILEALAVGLPVVATPITTRSFGSNFAGIVEAQTADDVASEVIKLLKNPEHSAEIGKEGRAAVIANFSWQSSVEKLERIYKEAIDCRKAK